MKIERYFFELKKKKQKDNGGKKLNDNKDYKSENSDNLKKILVLDSHHLASFTSFYL